MNATASRTRTSAASPPADVQKRQRLYGIIVSVLLALGVVFVFAQVRHFDFVVIDDGEYVTDNPAIKSGLSWETVKWTFTHTVAANWHPLAMLSHALDCQLFGQNAAAHHLVNVGFHAANTVLLFWVLLALLRPVAKDSTPHMWMCGIVAALFGWHPLRAESVAWVSERKDVLSTFFFMLILLAYTRYVRARENKKPAALFYAATLVFFALGLLAKPMLVTVPFVLLLIDFWPLQRLTNQQVGSVIFEKVPLFLLSGALSVTTFVAQKNSGTVVALQSFPLTERLANVVVSYARYLGKTFWPKHLCAYYKFHTWSAAQVSGALLLFAALSALALWCVRKRPYVFVGWFWFVGMLVPVIGITQVGGQSMADRYAYLPHIGLFIALVWGLFEVARKPALVLLSVGAIGCAVVAANQVDYWRDSEALFQHVIDLNEKSVSANYFMALALEGKNKLPESIPYFEEAVRGNPDNIKAHCHLGRILVKENRLNEAKQQFEAALQVDPDLPLTHFDLGDLLMKQGKRDEAIEHYIAALKSRPDMPEAHFDLANMLASKRDYEGAISHLQMANQLKPHWPVALNSLAWTLATLRNPKLRNGPEAVRLAEEAVALTKGDPGMMDTLATAYAEAGRFPDAIKTAESAIRVATASGQTNFVTEVNARLQLFRAGTAYHE
jgi:protein O-mannosyl-transferase